MKNNIIDSKLIQEKLKEYQTAEQAGIGKVNILQQQLAMTNQQVVTLQGAIAAMKELLPQKKEPIEEKDKEKNIVSFKKNKGGKNGKETGNKKRKKEISDIT